MTSVVCPSCALAPGAPANVSWSPAVDVARGTYVACAPCGILRLDPFPDAADVAALYGDGYFEHAEHGGYAGYTADEKLHRRNARRRLGHLGEPPRPGGVFVDVGCAHGYTMVEARRVGWDPVGVELNAAARSAGADAGMRAVESIDDLGLADGSVDALSFFQSLEHVPDVEAAVTSAARLLAPGGRLVVETWDRESLVARISGRRWQQLTPPSVLWVFGRADLRDMLDGAGFDVARHRPSMKWVSVATVLGQLGQRSDRGGVRGALQRASAAVGRIPLPYALGDLVTLVATRR